MGFFNIKMQSHKQIISKLQKLDVYVLIIHRSIVNINSYIRIDC